jgi:hypothetical protein
MDEKNREDKMKKKLEGIVEMIFLEFEKMESDWEVRTAMLSLGVTMLIMLIKGHQTHEGACKDASMIEKYLKDHINITLKEKLDG